MNKYILAILLLFTVRLYADDLVIKEYVPSPQDIHYGITLKRLMYMDQSGHPVKFIDYFSESYSAESGVSMQISYFKDDLPYLYEMYFIESVQSETGLKIKRDYINKDDKIIRIEVELLNGTTWSLSEALYDKYKFTLLTSFISPDPAHYEKGIINYEAPVYAGISYIEITNKINPIDIEYVDFIKMWLQMHKYKDISFAYKGMMSVNINDIECILLFQKNVFDIQSFPNALIQFYYLGSYDDHPLLMVMGYLEPM